MASPGLRRAAGPVLGLVCGLAVALLVGWAVLGWTTQLLLPVGVVAVAWAVGEVVRRLLELEEPPR
ncbi:hypothetical protein [Angustibacter speluncae]